jgi:hypothetical protein
VEPPISPGILDDAHALAIGRIALAFGDLELIATYFLSPLIGSDGWVGPLVIGGQAIAWQLDKIRQLAPRRLDAEAATRLWLGPPPSRMQPRDGTGSCTTPGSRTRISS